MRVAAVHFNATHSFSKTTHPSIELIAGLGVWSDAHCGVTVKHRSRVAKDPTQPNLRQVHLLHEELFAEVSASGLQVQPGQMGENITTRGIDLLVLSAGTRLKIGSRAVIEITGLRNPCSQIERFQPGLLAAVLGHASNGSLVRKAGVMPSSLLTGPFRLAIRSLSCRCRSSSITFGRFRDTAASLANLGSRCQHQVPDRAP